MVSLQLLLTLHNCRPATLSERHPHEGQQPLAFCIGLGCCCDAHIHPVRLTNSVEPDFGEDALITDSNAVVSMAIKAAWVHTLEVPCPGKPQIDQPV